MSDTYISVKVVESGVRLVDIKGEPIELGLLHLQKELLKTRKHPGAKMSINIWQGTGATHVKLLTMEERPLVSALNELQQVIRKIR
jgi:hypothetical protein